MPYYDPLKPVAVLASAHVLAFIAYATWSPIEDRPTVAGQTVEHVVAFALSTMLFTLAFS